MGNKKLIFSMMAFFGACLLLDQTVFAATTYYVRLDGGTPTQCTGTTNAAYPGSGSAQHCALNHPVWALGAQGTKGLMSGGDTLVFDDINHATGSQAQYKIGYGMPNTVSANCYINWSYSCVMSPVPSGPDAVHPTKIVGINYNTGCGTKPQLWGTDGATQIFNLSGSSNVDMECMELTDHSNCGLRVGSPVCTENYNVGQLSGPWARTGVYAQGGSNFTFVNMDVHGFAARAFLMGGINGITFSYVNMDGNYMSNWDGDVGESIPTGKTNNVSYNSGAIVLDHVKNRFAGCSEAYPRSSTFNTADYTNCTDQNDNPPGYGDGVGMYTTGGNWVITNSEFSHNTQDGLDLLYHDGTGSITVQRSLFEGNDGNQLKVTAPSIDVENSVLIGNCNYLVAANKIKNKSTFVGCRAGGDTVAMTVTKGGTYRFVNSTFYAGGNSEILLVNRLNTCNGTEAYSFRNNIYMGNGSSDLYINSLGGSCTKAPLDTDYSIVDNISVNYCPSGAHNKCSTDPKWVASISQAASSNLPNIYLQSTSPAIGTGLIIAGLSALDFNGVNRSPYWNMGAIQNVSTSTPPVSTPIVVTTPVVTAPVTTTVTTVVKPPVTPVVTVTLAPKVTFVPVTTTTTTTTNTWGTPVSTTTTTSSSTTSSPSTVKVTNGSVTFVKAS